ncbi:MAG: radical SAM protein [Anaerolineaceae bacterium]
MLSKHFDLGIAGIHAIAYNTREQDVAVFEGDSAEVWRLLYENSGDPCSALAFIKRNGSFSANPDTEARSALADFCSELVSQGLLESAITPRNIAAANFSGTRSTSDAQRHGGDRTELAFTSLLADHRVLYSLTLELTYRCNESCVHCYCPGDRARPELTLGQINELLDEFEALGGFSLHLTGGEVFLRKDIKQILQGLKKRSLLLSITSNLTLLDDEAADLVASLYPKSVGCSIYSARPELHDLITRQKGSFEHSIAAIRKLRERGVPVAIKTPVMASNASAWREVVALGQDLGCENQFDLNITARNDGDLAPVDLRLRDNALIEDILKHAFPQLVFGDERPSQPPRATIDSMLCGAGGTGLAISPDGTVHPCIALLIPLGKWPGNRLQDIWKRSDFFRDWSNKKLHHIAECASCDVSSYCIRCPGAWAAEHGGALKPIEYSCALSRSRARVQG